MLLPTVVVKPKFIIIGNRCYRSYLECLNNIQNGFSESDENDFNTLFDKDDIKEYEIYKDGQYFCYQMNVAHIFFPKLIGKGGKNISQIKLKGRSNILLNNPNQVVIKSCDCRALKYTKNLLDKEIKRIRNSFRPTHFVSIPLSFEQFMKNFISFRDEACKLTTEQIKIFINPKNLHLTLSLLFLGDSDERNKASQMLREFLKNWITMEKRNLEIEIKGINYLGKEPKQAHVVYACIEENNTIKNLANAINEHFKDNFGVRDETIKLHITLMNTSFLIKDEVFKVKMTFDASRILKNFKNFYFGHLMIDEIAIYEIGTSEDNYNKLFSYNINQIEE